MKSHILLFAFLGSLATMAAVTSDPPHFDNVPTVEKRFSGNDASDVDQACRAWLQQFLDDMKQKGLTILSSGCARNPIIAPPQVVFHAKVYFIR
jgi:hypothetical protein